MRFLAFTLLVSISAAGVAIGTAGVARAQSSAAQDLYEQGRTLMTQSRYAEACPKFEASLKIDPGATGTLLNLAHCFELIGKPASAWAMYKEATTAAHALNETDREKLAQKGVSGLDAELSKIRVVAAPTPGLEVHLDGIALIAGSLDTDLAVDPGPHTLEATAAGHVPFKTTVTINPHGDRQTVTISPLAVEPAEPAGAPTVIAPPSAVNGPVVAPTSGGDYGGSDAGSSSGSPIKPLGFAAIGVGVAGLIVGGVTGAIGLSKQADLLKHCPQGACPSNTGPVYQSDVDSYQTMKTVSTVSLIAGGALAVTGVVLLAAAPKAKSPLAGLTLILGPGYCGAKGVF